MFTVIFAEKEIIKLFEETKMFFGPLLDDKKLAFCEWDKSAKTFESMVPDIYEIIEFQTEWRAVVLTEENISRINPFDFTLYKEDYYKENVKDWQFFKKRRESRFLSYEKAVDNPLLKLTVALCGIPNFKSVIPDEEFEALVNGNKEVFEYMLKCQLESLNCREVAARYEKYQKESLKRFVPEESVDSLIDCLRNSDVSGIVSMIPDTEILGFIQYVGNDPIYYDPEYTECLIENTQKSKILSSIAADFSMTDKLPSEVICLSPRTFDFENVEQEIKWKKKDENSYSRFADFNLYSDKLKFILFDILEKDNKQYKFEQIKMICLLLIIARNELPKGCVNASQVYRANIDFDLRIVNEICEKYVSKLKATEILLKEIRIQVDHEHQTTIDNKTAQRLFESEINIPVRINSENKKTDLFAHHKELGLSTDCPEHESVFWSTQYRKINQHFHRYLREPKRAVKSAVCDSLRANNSIDDERTLLLNENQIEDLNLHLLEEEQKMVDMSTSHLFNTKKFYEEMHEADKEIKRTISQRMTKSKTLFVGLAATIAYFIGFLPIIFTAFNNMKSFLFSLAVTGVVIAIFLALGFLYLFVLRKKLVNRFIHFNHVMSGICNNIQVSLGQFSNYLSCVCNVMRGFSALKKRDSEASRIKKIVSFHEMRIRQQQARVYEMFSKYVDFKRISVSDCEPYGHDFTLMKEYDYEMPSIESPKKIEYMQNGYEIVLPIDYVDSIGLTREDLYD